MSDDTVMKENMLLRAALERMLLEFDFMIESGIIPDIRDDFIFVEARAALDPNSNPNRTAIG
jgi:hypothetical protein